MTLQHRVKQLERKTGSMHLSGSRYSIQMKRTLSAHVSYRMLGFSS